MCGPICAPGPDDKIRNSYFFPRRCDKGLRAGGPSAVRENGPGRAAPALLLESTRGCAHEMESRLLSQSTTLVILIFDKLVSLPSMAGVATA